MKLAGNYNDKRGNDHDSYEQELIDLGPTYAIHRTADQNTAGFLTGSGSLLNGGGYGTVVLEKSSYSMIRGDLTWYKQGWGGAHEFQTGFLLMPKNQLSASVAAPGRHVEPDRSGGVHPARCVRQRQDHLAAAGSGRSQQPCDREFVANTPTWTPGSFRLAGPWNTPKNVVVSGSYTAVGGPWTGPILTRLPANSPDVLRFGPANVVNAQTGRTFANPLATRIRFLYPTRGEGQEGLPYVHTINMKLGYGINFTGRQYVQIGANIFNIMNAGRYTEWHRSGANLAYEPTFYLVQDNQQTSRAYQVDITYRF